ELRERDDFFSSHHTAPPACYTLSLHDALPISLFFDFREIGAFVPGGFRIVIVGNRVEARTFGLASSDYDIGHANDGRRVAAPARSEEHTSELQSLAYLVCRLLLEKKKKK